MEKSINIHKINKLLNQGLVPNEMYYTKEKKIIIEPEKVDYNLYPVQTFYDSVIEDINSMKLSPFEEYKLRKENNIDKYIDE